MQCFEWVSPVPALVPTLVPTPVPAPAPASAPARVLLLLQCLWPPCPCILSTYIWLVLWLVKLLRRPLALVLASIMASEIVAVSPFPRAYLFYG